ncbi:MAG TPA: DEAD/DEAH box helicase, partial [Blastocatellia bacterium]|nr:DEAD/DEAH box helicase [Blastocatellia bacterium]
MNFSELGLHPALAKQCESLGYSEPTPIQGRAVPVILGGADLIGCAETGTGKTAAFLLPLIQKIASSKGVGVRALILSPTRELASQIESNLRALDPKNRTRSVMLIGGTGFGRQLDGLRQGVPIVIATPGRLLDHIER